MTWILKNTQSGNTKAFDARAKAEKAKQEQETLGANVVLEKQPKTDGGTVEPEPESEATEVNDESAVQEATPVETEENAVPVEEQTQIPDAPAVDEDPINWMPDHFTDVIDGVQVINRKGYAVLAEHYDISVIAEPVTIPSESDWEYAEFRATATTPDGEEYAGYGSAHVDRGDDKTLLGELAETRACKRSISWATGVGMVAVSEMKGEL